MASTQSTSGAAASFSLPSDGNGTIPANPPFKGSVLKAFEGKNVLITGGTGFLGKVLIEKILRSIPNVNKLYVLVRPRKGSTAHERMLKEVVSSEVFARLRRERGADFEPYVLSKLHAVAGELTQNQVGFSDKDLAMIQDNVHMILHCAAIVDFNERVDRAVELNVMGSLRLMEIAKRCKHMGAFVHVSTAYVNSNRRGWIDEKLYPLGFDANEMIKKIRSMNTSELERITVTGLLGDWPNTYTFTKAMTEHLLVQERASVPLVILRPTIVGSSWREPVPGWVDCLTAAGAVYAAVGMGVVKFLPGSPNTIADIVPVDYVINTILASIPAIYNEDRYFVVQSATSSEKPMRWGTPRKVVQRYFSEHPPEKRVGKPEFTFLRSGQAYQTQFFLRYSVPSAVLNTVATVVPAQRKRAALFNKLLWKVRVIIEAFKYFVENEWQFDNRHTRVIGQMLNEQERKIFPLDLSTMDWDSYNFAFAYGLSRYVLKGDLVELGEDFGDRQMVRLHEDSFEGEDLSVQGVLRQLFGDFEWASEHLKKHASLNYPPSRPVEEMMSYVLSTASVQAAIKEAAKAMKGGLNDANLLASESRARSVMSTMFGDTSLPVVAGMGYLFRKIWRRIYSAIEINAEGLEAVKAAAQKGPLIFLPTHRSYIDFLVVSYLCFACGLPMPHIAAGEDFLGILLVRWLFRKSGAFFLRRSFMGGDDAVYESIFREYVTKILMDGQSLEFFVEGTRSRSGKMLHPKIGLMSIVTDAYLDGKVGDMTLVPVSINYEKTMEGNLYSNELLGDRKIKESLRSLLQSSSVLNINFGSITVGFGQAIPLKSYVANLQSNPAAAAAVLTVPAPVSIAPFFEETKHEVVEVSPKKSSRKAEREKKEKESAVVAFDPFNNKAHRKPLNRALAYDVIQQLHLRSECMTTHLVASLMLMYRQGINKAQLVQKVDWLRKQVEKRGGRIAGMEGHDRVKLVEQAVQHLGAAIVQHRQDLYEPAISARHEYKNMLVLGQYRNKIVHLFFREGLWACALYSFGDRMMERGVDKALLLREVQFLYALLKKEFVFKLNPEEPEDLEAALASMVNDGVLSLTPDQRVELNPNGEALFSFLCALFWPFIDSYYVSAMILFSLQPDRSMELTQLVQRTQSLATTLYHESMLCFYESCSLETLRSALLVLREWQVISVTKSQAKGQKEAKAFVSLNTPYHEEGPLNELVRRISRLRKQPPVRKNVTRSSLVADIPILAKL